MSPETPNRNSSSHADAYTTEDVQAYSSRALIRRRPGMYVGDRGVRGLLELVYQLLDNALNEVVAGYSRHIEVELLGCGGCRVTDDGRGIPVEATKDGGRRIFEIVLTDPSRYGPVNPVPYRVEAGRGCLGLCVVNALSTDLVVEIWREGRFWRQWFQRSQPCHSPHSVQIASERTGTRIAFWPDREIFQETQRFQFDLLQVRLRELAALHKGVTLRLTDHRGLDTRTEAFYYPSGLADYFRHVAAGRSPIHPHVIHFSGERDGCGFEVAMQWTDSPGELILSFVNGHQTISGTQVTGLRNAVVAALRTQAEKALTRRNRNRRLDTEDFRAGLVAVVAVTTPEQRYEGSTKERIGNPEIQAAVGEVGVGLLAAFLDGRPEDARAIVGHIVTAFNARSQGNRV